MSTLAEQRRQKVATQSQEREAKIKVAKELANRLTPEMIVDDYMMSSLSRKLIEKGTLRLGYYDFQIDPRSDYFDEIAKAYKSNDNITKKPFLGKLGFFGGNGDHNYMNKRLFHLVASSEYVYTVIAKYLEDFDIRLTKIDDKSASRYLLSIIEEEK